MFSFHPLENAFWNLPQPQFNIYDALLVDDLHQIGGVYKHLLKFVEGYHHCHSIKSTIVFEKGFYILH
ncbi:hypothetical protein BJV82DRAFT_322667 [Fennellomyces sp. T-0311]|nr:hypothetical protein BJV82DRAFT_322667 [Fennellomyces sp. T-0311]